VSAPDRGGVRSGQAERSPAGTRWPRLITSGVTLSWLAMASVVMNVILVVTGGAVRLTGSGLGCPSWPQCTIVTLTHNEKLHKFIELNNRRLTGVLAVVVVATLVVAVVQRRQRVLAWLLAASIPAQAVLGGITVLTKLNPWTVAAHLLLSMVIIAIAYTLWWRVSRPTPSPAGRAPRTLATVLLGLTAAVLAAGTVVTGSGPHAGSADEFGRIHRTGLSVAATAQLHADLVMLLVGCTVGFVILVRATGAAASVYRSGLVLLGIELAQGVVGYVQYFTGVPSGLVAVHMLGATLTWLAALGIAARCGLLGRSEPTNRFDTA
jgi:cytochrome c oxidase assembly protein subunit 15